MTDNLRESISALMDDEANELEVRRILNHLDKGDEDNVRHTLHRYQLASAALQRNSNHNLLDVDLSGRIADAIAQEDIAADTADFEYCGHGCCRCWGSFGTCCQPDPEIGQAGGKPGGSRIGCFCGGHRCRQ